MKIRSIGAATAALLFVSACGGGDAPDRQEAPETPREPTPAAEAPASTGPAALAQVQLPEGVTLAMVESGQELFSRQICMTCHGMDATGMANLGPDLTDATWINSDGTYEAIVTTIMEGVTTPKEFPGSMPPKGGMPSITDEQVRELAAYVYAVSRASE